MRTGLPVSLLATLFLCASWGCNRTIPPETIVGAQLKLTEGTEKFQAKAYADAEAAFSAAVASGSLPLDVQCEAMTRRAECLVRIGQPDAAFEILNKLEQGAPDMASVHVVKAFAYEKAGRSNQAAEELRKAKQYNPSVQKLTD